MTATGPTWKPETCAGCGAPHPSRGTAPPKSSGVPEERRKTVWTCASPECLARASAYVARAIDRYGFAPIRRAERPAEERQAPPPPRQASLL